MILGLIFLVASAAAAIVAHLVAAKRNGGDAGAFWAWTLSGLCLLVGLPFLLISCLESVARVHKWLPAKSIWWLLVLFLVWVLILLTGVARKHERKRGIWIAGILQRARSRKWVLLLALPFLPALIDLWPQWLSVIDAGHWAMVCLLMMVLVGIAFSRAALDQADASKPADGPDENQLPCWPEEMERGGVRLRKIAEWMPLDDREQATGIALDWQRRLEAVGLGAVSGLLCQAVSRLLVAGMDPIERASFVLGPDHCGQEETVALAALELAQRFGETTLLVTSAPDPLLVQRLQKHLNWIGGSAQATITDLSAPDGGGVNDSSTILLTDAETLSANVLSQLRAQLDGSHGPAALQETVLVRIGLVVWWNAHEFSGVDAAHVWAVSRRLQRLLDARRRPPSRALVFARTRQSTEAALWGFLEHLTPYVQAEANRFRIATTFAHRTHLYLLEDGSQEGLRKAAALSQAIGWKTCAQISQQRCFSATDPGLVDSIPWAGACILGVNDEEMLSIREMICRGGRSLDGIPEFHVALVPSDNPYAQFLLGRYQQQTTQEAALNLIGAEGHVELVQRHLLLALREVPDTLTGLRGCFRWKESTLRQALDTLSRENRLIRRPVRFLDATQKLQRDALYENLNPGQVQVHGFRVIGRTNGTPVELRNHNVRDLLIRQVDPERLALEAYPQQVVERSGTFYRVSEAGDAAAGRSANARRIDCIRVDEGIKTWPYFSARVTDVVADGDKLSFPGLVCTTAQVHYAESVLRILERTPEGSYRTVGISTSRASFDTQAILLEFSQPLSDYQLASAALVLEWVLPIYAAVGQDTVRVVSYRQGSSAALAIVELFPGGIGVVEAMRVNTWLIPTLFKHAKEWLSQMDASERKRVATSPLFQTRMLPELDAEITMKVFAQNFAG